MVWTREHDVLLARDILVAKPFSFKFGSRERGQAWDKVAEAVNLVQHLRFNVDQKGVRERYDKLKKAYQKCTREEERASAISPEVSELDEALKTSIELSSVAEKELIENQSAKNKQVDKERESADTVRKRSMERLSQTRDKEGIEKSKKQKRSGVGMIEYLEETKAREENQNKVDIEIRERHLALEERKHNDILVIKRNELLVKEKELAILAMQQQEREKRDMELLGAMKKIEQQQDILT